MRYAWIIAVVIAVVIAGGSWWAYRPMGPGIAWVLAITLVTFLTYGADKLAARWERSRVSERTLLGLVAVGGTIGALVGMPLFRHKTAKRSFLTRFALIVSVQMIILLGVIYMLRRPSEGG